MHRLFIFVTTRNIEKLWANIYSNEGRYISGLFQKDFVFEMIALRIKMDLEWKYLPELKKSHYSIGAIY